MKGFTQQLQLHRQIYIRHVFDIVTVVTCLGYVFVGIWSDTDQDRELECFPL